MKAIRGLKTAFKAIIDTKSGIKLSPLGNHQAPQSFCKYVNTNQIKILIINNNFNNVKLYVFVISKYFIYSKIFKKRLSFKNNREKISYVS